ncbi:MAG TPA: DedA family protein [Candidatus Saccharimonadales bacterium]|nr:DedA family protein [Candidatus Saccharimonadales bacterium]
MVHHLNSSLDLITDTYYFILFPLLIIEGPVVMIAAGFLVSLGYYGLWDVYLAAITASLCGDFIHYSVGRWGRTGILDRWGHLIRITPKTIARVEDHFRRHPGKTLVAGKWSFAFTGVVLVAAGISRMPLRRFFFYNLLGELPKSLLLILTGYYLGDAYAKGSKYLSYSVTVIFLIGVVALGFFYLSRYLRRRLG